MAHPILAETEQKMRKSLELLTQELRTVRTGRATPALVDGVRVEYYGTPTPLKQLAAVSAPEPHLVVVKPFDRSTLADIEKAILRADLGLNPQNDGKVLRVPVPPLSEERRRQLVQLVKDMGERTKTALRNVRRDANKSVDDAKSRQELSEDVAFRLKDDIQKLLHRHETQVQELLEKKSKEVLEV